jgi:hypothetical protein
MIVARGNDLIGASIGREWMMAVRAAELDFGHRHGQ